MNFLILIKIKILLTINIAAISAFIVLALPILAFKDNMNKIANYT